MVKANIPISGHYSDLYAKCTPESEAIVERYEFKQNVTTFRNNIDNTLWFDIPFQYQPYWDARLS